MKKLYLLFICLSLIEIQAQNCSTAQDLCMDSSSYTFSGIINTPGQADGINYGCLGTYQNKSWFNLRIGVGGDLNFQVSQFANADPLVGLDVDYIIWGPFASEACGPALLNPESLLDCNFDSGHLQEFAIENAQSGEYYTLMLANFSNQAGQITLTQTNAGSPNAGFIGCESTCTLSVAGGAPICEGSALVLQASIPEATYQWSLNNVSIPGETGREILITQPGSYTVTVSSPECGIVSATTVIEPATPPVTSPPNNLFSCSGNNTFDLTVNTPVILGGLNPNFYILNYFETAADAQNIANPILMASAYTAITSPQTIYFSIEELTGSGCITVGSFTLNTTSTTTAEVSINSQTLIVIADGIGPFMYQLNGGAYQSANVFYQVPMGTNVTGVKDGCDNVSYVTFEIVTPSAPLAISPQNFGNGATLANISVNGQNIQWYLTDGSGSGLMPSQETPLPMDTLLIGGTTYYASQTINGVESTERIPVLVSLGLSVADNHFSGFSFQPNPVKNTLHLMDNELLGKLAVYNLLGQKVADKLLNSMNVSVDLSTLETGIYIVKVYSGTHEKSIRIIKE